MMRGAVWLGTAIVIATPVAAEPIAVLDTPLILTRTLQRPLGGEAVLVVRRRYEVRIVRDGASYRVDGRLLGAEVEAPPSLQAFAELERNRPDPGLFPLALDAAGRIVSDSRAAPSEPLDRAAALAQGRLSAGPLPPMELAQAQAFVRQLQARASGSRWPDDLFHPAPGAEREERAIPLPDGKSGSVTIETARERPQTGDTIATHRRTVATELAGDRRVSREEWTLVRAR